MHKGFIDLHSHWVAGIDDGAKTAQESLEMLNGLAEVGFGTVVATPHMRTGMFDNSRADLEHAYQQTLQQLESHEVRPAVQLSCEHHLDDLVFRALMAGQGLPYSGGKAALIEFPYDHFPLKHTQRLFELRCKRIRPVLAHPERYRPVWKNIEVLDPILDGGTVLLLDLGALIGAHGRGPKKCAHQLVEEGYYYAACSDAHRPKDALAAARGIERLYQLLGDEEAEFLLVQGPRNILEGSVED